jgi:hypothetical protein
MLDDLVWYLESFMKATDFAMLASWAVRAASNDGTTFNPLKEPHWSLIVRVLTLCQGFLHAGGASEEAMAAVRVLLEETVWKMIGPKSIAEALTMLRIPFDPANWAVVGPLVLLGSTAHIGGQRLPYSTITRDFSEEMRERLIQIVKESHPAHLSDWGLIHGSDDPRLDFRADDAALQEYHHQMVERYSVTIATIDTIFNNVRQYDRSVSLKIDAITHNLSTLTQAIQSI